MDLPPVLAREAEVEPHCRHFGVCGGCQMQHLTAATQVRRKLDSLRSQLDKSGVAGPEPEVHTAAEYGYRNRIRLRVEGGRLGYSHQGSHAFVAIEECPIAAPLLWRVAATLEELGQGATPWPAGSSELELVTDGEEHAVQVLLHVQSTVGTLDRDAPRMFRALCEALQARVPEMAGGGLLAHGELSVVSKRVQDRQRVEVARWGTPQLLYRVGDANYRVSRGAFFQVNRFLTGRMVHLVVGLRSGRGAWDLFAGAGLFSVPLTARFNRVTAVEVSQPAASDLAAALSAVGPEHRAVAQPVLTFLRQRQAPLPDLVVLDPPRAGLGSVLSQQLVQAAVPVLVYVSCDALSFARDARTLVDSRYTITELHLLDLFPQTNHTETIAVFRQS